MRPVLERCDSSGCRPTSTPDRPRSRDLYMRHGFEVTEEFRLPDEGPPLWRMWREPQ